MIEHSWLSFYIAANEIERRLGVSGGVAMRKLRDACASGDVRSQRQPYNPATGIEEGPPETVKPSDWRRDEVDLECDADGCRYFVDVDEADFRYWFDRQKPEEKSKPSKKGKVPLVIDYLKQMYPLGVPDPARCPRKDLLAVLRTKDKILSQLDDGTLKKAIEEYNRLIRSALI
jgi:hypothetical protein